MKCSNPARISGKSSCPVDGKAQEPIARRSTSPYMGFIPATLIAKRGSGSERPVGAQAILCVALTAI